MKTLVHTLILATLLAIVAMTPVSGQNAAPQALIASPIEPAVAVPRTTDQTQDSIPPTFQVRSTLAEPVVAVARSRNRTQYSVLSTSQVRSAKAGIFVVPAGQRKPEDLKPVFEDLHVMCRIFDKRLDPSAAARAAGPMPNARENDLLGMLWAMNKRTVETEALYLDGYGVVFFVNVPFPLVLAESQQEPETESQPAGDPLWQSVREETLYGNETSAQDRGPEEAEIANRRATTILTESLIQTLRHATNIRSLEADQNIIIRITGKGEPRPGRPRSSSRRRSAYGGAYDSYGSSGTSTSATKESTLQTTLIIRTTKTTVDDFSAGKLTFEQFKAKAQVITMNAPGTDSTPTADPTGMRY